MTWQGSPKDKFERSNWFFRDQDYAIVSMETVTGCVFFFV